MKACVYTLGCKVNDVESGSLIGGLEKLGYEVVREMERADLYIVNTCAVTAEAERKSRQIVSKAQKQNPKAKVIVCGCASEKSPKDFREKGVYYVGGTRKKGKILEFVRSDFDATVFSAGEEAETYEEMPPPKCLKTRNFVKIQDGCNRFCSYCVIPYLRGRSRSRALASAASEILSSKAQETVVTGIDISEYKDEDGNDLTELMRAVREADTRIRLGSLEVSAITAEFLTALQGLKCFAPQFHLSLQSGSDAVLRSMNRHYTRAEYLEKCAMIYKAFPDAAITTDVIVGFPTETEADFAETLRIVSEAGFAQIHAFPYSPREGTNAYKRYKELPAAVKKSRLERLLEEGAKQKKAYMERFIGKRLCLAPENCFDGVTEGYSENYIRVYVNGELEKRLTRVRVEGLFRDGVIATADEE